MNFGHSTYSSHPLKSSASSLLHWSICNSVRIHWKKHWCWERWRQEEKVAAENKVIVWHHQLNGYEFEEMEIEEDRESWPTSVHGVTKRRTWFSDWTRTKRKTLNAQKYYQGAKSFLSRTDQNFHLISFLKNYIKRYANKKYSFKNNLFIAV